jgi:hypothetical protein
MNTTTKDEFEALLPPDFEYLFDEWSDCYQYDVCFDGTVSVRIRTSIKRDTNRSQGETLYSLSAWHNKQDRSLGMNLAQQSPGVKEFVKKLQEFSISKMEQRPKIHFWNYVQMILRYCDWMEFSRSLLESYEKFGTLTEKQLAWVIGETNPKGKKTMEGRFLDANPGFKERNEIGEKPETVLRRRVTNEPANWEEERPRPIRMSTRTYRARG